MELRRDIKRWQGLNPKAVAEGSTAQAMFCIEDAVHDITTLHARVEALEAQLSKTTAAAIRRSDKLRAKLAAPR